MTKVKIQLSIARDPIEVEMPNYDSKQFTNALNGQVMFIEIGGNVINRNLIQAVTPIETQSID